MYTLYKYLYLEHLIVVMILLDDSILLPIVKENKIRFIQAYDLSF